MAPPLDKFGYSLTALVTVGMQLFFFAVAYGCSFDLVTDLAGSSNFVLIAVLTLALGPGGFSRTRPLVLTALLTASRVELASFLLFRVCRRKKDARFDEVRQNFWRFLVFWIYQMAWAWFGSLPVVFVNSVSAEEQPELGAADFLGWTAFVVGFLFQVFADAQKYRFRADPANRGRFCSIGLWSISRHPNYFGELLLWWGIWASAAVVVVDSASPGAAWMTLVCPLWTMFVLLFFSGLPTAEGDSLARYYEDPAEGQRWEQYRHRTSPLVPLPPAVYARLPALVKRGFLCEFRFLEYKALAEVVAVRCQTEPVRLGDVQTKEPSAAEVVGKVNTIMGA